MSSPKSKTNKKWTSNDDFKSNYDRIFAKKKECPACGGEIVNKEGTWVCYNCKDGYVESNKDL